MKHVLTVLMVLVSFSLIFGANQVAMEKAPGQFDPVSYVNTQKALFNKVISEAAPLSSKAIFTIQVSEAEIAEVNGYECETCGKNQKLRVGIAKPAGVFVEFEDVNAVRLNTNARFRANGMIRAMHDGYVWTAAVQSDKATAIRIHFSNFSLPAGSSLYIYNTDGEAFGPYTDMGPRNTGDFWTNTVTGPVAYIQVRHSGQFTQDTLDNTHFVIQDVAHMGEKFLLPFLKKERTDRERDGLSWIESICSFNADCIEDAKCYNSSTWSPIEDVRNAIAHMQFIEMPYIYICSGGLLADTDTSTQVPYFLTANHCISQQSTADTLECYWQFWTTTCGGACYDPVGAVPRTLGATLLSTNSTGDYCFMQLGENPPAGSVFLGWYTTSVAYNSGYELYRISHPSGAPQAFSKHEVNTTTGTCSGWPRGDWIYSKDLIGATEGGSSGSPVLNASGQVVGQLSGACGYNVNDPCDTTSNSTVDGAFATYYNSISQWLDPGTSSGINLTLSKIKIRAVQYVDLAWTGAVGTNVNIYRNGTLIATVSNSGSYRDELGRKPVGTFIYKVCETDGSACSNEPSASF
jgi:lysyl endopeptidase